MSRKKKFYFGIFEDGKSIKIAQLQMQKNAASVISLQKELMDEPLYAESVLKKKSLEQSDMGSTGAINLNEQSSEFEMDTSEDMQSKFMALDYLLRRFPLQDGKLALNVNNDKLSFHTVNLPSKKITRSKLVELEILKPYEKRDKKVLINFLPTVKEQTTVIIHRGENKLFNLLQDYNKKNSYKNFFYSLIDSNDVLLTDYLQNSEELELDSNTLMLYLGHDYKKGIIMEGKTYQKSFPIMTSTSSFDVKEEIYSKLMLMEDEGDIPKINKIIIAGDYSKEEDIEFFAEKYDSIKVKRASFENFPLSIDPEISEEEIAIFIVPIMLALKAMNLKNLSFTTSNFLSEKVIEAQKPFKIGWHGFLILAAIFVVGVYLTNSYLIYKQQLKEVTHKNKNLEFKLEAIEQDKMIIQNIQKQISEIEQSEKKITEILKNKNKWTYILNKFAYAFATHPQSWLVNLQNEKDNFSVTGYTDDRQNVIYFSKLFPNSKIMSVTSDRQNERNIWRFEITFSYPEINTLEIIASASPKTIPTPKVNKTRDTRNEHVDAKDIKNSFLLVTDAYKKGHKERTLQLAEDFIAKFPQAELALNCKYLIGEIIYQQGQTKRAEKLFDEVIETKNNMAPYALYMKAKLYAYKHKNIEKAIHLLDELKKYYTTSPIIPKAQKLYNKLEGHNE
ncbi:MAG: hypothetical protein SVM86_05270 [Candidatus Cloacimonadota bacterium]|nr:hypothetical protein [Candidatus Cloacimonadota bacterium]